ncbi:MAG: hypothetical protein SFY68_06065 [Candidatus Sumerlaeia bacterium]|nr:hypothetical protein [Candidatus Sumerlaeia bacterium]
MTIKPWLFFLLGVFPLGLSASNKTNPAEVTLTPLVGSKADGQIELEWVIEPKYTPISSSLILGMRRIGETDFDVLEKRTLDELVAGKASKQTLHFSPPGPGKYVLSVSTGLEFAWAQDSISEVICLDVAEDGTFTVVPERTISAAEFSACHRFGLPVDSFEPPTPAIVGAPDIRGGEYPTANFTDSDKASGPSFNVRGYYRFTNRKYTDGEFTGTEVLPVIGATVRIFEQDEDFTLLGTTTTNSNGYFNFLVPNNNDPEGGKRDIAVQLLCESAIANVGDHGNNLYDIDGATKLNWPGGTLHIGTVTLPLATSGPFHILDTLRRGHDYAKARGENSLPKVKARWAVGSAIGTSYNNSQTMIKLVGTAADPDEFDDDVILHEYGHMLSQRISYDKTPGGDHSWYGEFTPELAWSEGWATFFSGIVRNSRFYVDHKSGPAFITNREVPNVGKPGDDSEGAVCGALWDIWDSSNDSPDSMSGGIQKIWTVFTNDFDSKDECTYQTFYEEWGARGLENYPNLQAIQKNFGIEYNDYAYITYPDQLGLFWTFGKKWSVKWTGFPGAQVRIELLNSNQNVSAPVLLFNTANDGSALIDLTSVDEVDVPVTGTYTVRVTSLSNPNIRDTSSQPFTIEQYPEVRTNPGAEPTVGNIAAPGEEDWYWFQIKTTRSVTIRTIAGVSTITDFGLSDTYMNLYGPNDKTKFIQKDDDSGGGGTSKIVRTLPPGDYFYKVEAFDPEATGFYYVEVD